MEPKERKVYLQTRLRNLKRKYSKIIQHSDLLKEAHELKKEIDNIDKEIKLMD